MVDPVGVDPRMEPAKNAPDPAVIRKILQTLTAFRSEPDVVCIEDLR